jgi:hypothetical protein
VISNGVLVRQELVGSVKFGAVSKASLFLAEIPMNLKRITRISERGNPLLTNEQRFLDIEGFRGTPIKDDVYLLLSRYDGNIKRSIVELVDLQSFEVKKTWMPDIAKINQLVNVQKPDFINMERDLTPKRYRIMHPFLTEDGGLIFQDSSPLVKIDKNSQLVWQNQKDQFHHSIEQDYDGSYWVPSRILPHEVDLTMPSDENYYLDDAITKVSESGEILFQKSVSNILLENNLSYALVPLINSGNLDPIHLNDIQPIMFDGPYWQRGDVFLSLHVLSMVILYRPSTNKIIWKAFGNDFDGVSYGSGQHDIDILDDHRISIFNNNGHGIFNDDGANEVIIYDFETNSYSNYFPESLVEYEVRTMSEGRSQILENGDLFIEEQNFGRILYFSNDKSLKWQYINRADDGSVYQISWSRVLYQPKDINKINKIFEIGS